MAWRQLRAVVLGSQAWQKDLPDGHLTVFVSTDDGARHLSISHRRDSRSGPVPGRNPRWEEIKDARYRFCPEVRYMVMVLPPLDEYVNVHETTFHLWESHEDWS